MEHVRPAQHRQRRQVPAERPAPDAHPRQVQPHPERLRRGLQRRHLVLQHRPRHVGVDRLLPGQADAGGAPSVGDQDREPLLGEPLRGQVGALGAEHALGVRTAVGVQQHRQRIGVGRVPGRQHQRGGDAPLAQPPQPHVHPRQFGAFGEARHLDDRLLRRRAPHDRGAHPRGGQVAALHHQGAAAQPPRVHPGGVVGAGEAHLDAGVLAAVVQPQPHVLRLLRRRRRVQHPGAVHVQHRPDVLAGSAHHPVAPVQHPFAGGVHPEAQGRARGVERRDARHDLHPDVGGLRPQVPHGAGQRVRGERAQGALGAVLHGEDHRRGAVQPVRPPRGDQVRQLRTVPLHPHRLPGAVRAQHRQPHLGVVRARRRVGDRLRGGLRAARVADVPAPHRGVVDAGGEQEGPVRGPPQAPVAAHLLGGDELGQAPGDVLPVGGGHDPVAAVGDVQHVDRAAADVGHRPARGRQHRVDDRGGRGQLPGSGRAVQLHAVELAGQGEDRAGERLVDAVGDDAAARLAQPFPPGPLLRRQVLTGVADRARVGDHPLRAVRLGDPQAGRGVRAVPAPQERHPPAVGGDLERTGHADAETLGTGVLTWEAHAPNSDSPGRRPGAPAGRWRFGAVRPGEHGAARVSSPA